MKTTTCREKTYEIRFDEAFKKTNAYMLLAELAMQIYPYFGDGVQNADFTSDDKTTTISIRYDQTSPFKCWLKQSTDSQEKLICSLGIGFNDDEYEALFIDDIQPDFKDWLNKPAIKKEVVNLDMFDLCIEC